MLRIRRSRVSNSGEGEGNSSAEGVAGGPSSSRIRSSVAIEVKEVSIICAASLVELDSGQINASLSGGQVYTSNAGGVLIQASSSSVATLHIKEVNNSFLGGLSGTRRCSEGSLQLGFLGVLNAVDLAANRNLDTLLSETREPLIFVIFVPLRLSRSS